MAQAYPARKPAQKPRVDKRVDEYRRVIDQAGQRVLWERAIECPCAKRAKDLVGTNTSLKLGLGDQNPATARGREECPSCKGEGWFWTSPQEIRAILTRAMHNPKHAQIIGVYGPASVAITTLPEHALAWRDRLTALDQRILLSEVVERGPVGSPLDSTRYPIARKTFDLQDGLRLVGVDHLHITDENDLAPVDGERVEGVDFETTESGVIDWTLGSALDPSTAPPEGRRYSVRYHARPRLTVLEIPHHFRDTWVKFKSPEAKFLHMPVQAIARLEQWNEGQGGVL